MAERFFYRQFVMSVLSALFTVRILLIFKDGLVVTLSTHRYESDYYESEVRD